MFPLSYCAFTVIKTNMGIQNVFSFGYSYLLGLKTLLQRFNWLLKEAVLICRVTLMCNVIDHNYPVIHRRSDTSIFLRGKKTELHNKEYHGALIVLVTAVAGV